MYMEGQLLQRSPMSHKVCWDESRERLKHVLYYICGIVKSKIHGGTWKEIDEEYLLTLVSSLLECKDPILRPLTVLGRINRQKYFPGSNVTSDRSNDIKGPRI